MGDVTYIDPNQKQVVLSQTHSDAIHCLIISLTDELVLLPNAAIAEVVGYIEPEPLEGSPAWFLGRVTWRERLVPLISLEIATQSNEASESVASGTRIAILNTLNGNQELPYIGIVSQGIPSLSVINQDDISSIETLPGNRQSVAEIAKINEQKVIIPDIDDLENRIRNIH